MDPCPQVPRWVGTHWGRGRSQLGALSLGSMSLAAVINLQAAVFRPHQLDLT